MADDIQLKQDVEKELNWDPSLDEAEIGVSVQDAIVTLSGHVRTYGEKTAAEEAVLRIRGVRAVVSNLDVCLAGHEETDEDIARTAANVLASNTMLPKEAVKVTVSGGRVTLSGAAKWQYQRAIAERLVSHLSGVKGVINKMQVKPAPVPTSEQVKAGIEAALKRSAELDGKHIRVVVRGRTVVLSGTVYSWSERAAAEKVAWAAPGVSKVENHIAVGLPDASAYSHGSVQHR